jgi:hypothetical protein
MPEYTSVQSILDAAEQAAAAGDVGAAEQLLRQAARLQEAQLGPQHPDLANTLNNLGVVCEQTGRLDEAEGFYRRAHEIAAAAFDPGHPFVITSRKNLADFCEARGRPLEPLPAAAATPAAAPKPVASPPPAVSPPPALSPSPAVSPPPADSRPTVERAIGKHEPSAAKHPSRPIATSSLLLIAVIAVLVIAVIWVIVGGWSNGPGGSSSPAPAPAAPAPSASADKPDAANTAAPVAADPGIPSTPAVPRSGGTEPDARGRSPRATAQVTVAEAQVCRRFSTSPDWRCEEAGSSVASGSLVYYTRIKAARATTVEHRWYHGNALQQRVELDVAANPSAGYRTYSRLAVSAAGGWRVEARSTDGTLLHEERFDVRQHEQGGRPSVR